MSGRWRFVVAVVVLGAVGGYLFRLGTDPVYESEVVVVASKSEILADEFGDLAKTLASTDTVLEPVIQELGLSTTPEELRRSGDLEAQAVPGAVAVRLIGRSTDADLARALARIAGETFASAAQLRGLGSFSVFGQGEPTDRGPQSPAAWAVIGGGLGGALGFVALLLLAFARRPILDPEQPARELSPHATFTLRLRRAPGGRWRAYPAGALAGIAGRVLAAPRRGVIAIVLVERRRRGDHQLRWLATELRRILSAPRQRIAILTVRGEIEALDANPPDVLPQADVVVAVVAAGAPSGSLELLSEAVGLLDEDSQRLLVYAARIRGRAKGPAPVVPVGEIPAVATGGRETAEPPPREPVSVSVSASSPPEPTPPLDAAQPTPADAGEGAVPTGPAPRAAAATPEASAVPAGATGGGRHAEEPDMLRVALGHPDPEIRRAALDELLLRPDPALIDAVRRQLADPEPGLRVLAVSVIAAMTEARARARPRSPRGGDGDGAPS